MTSWPARVLISQESITEESYYKNYDKNFNDEQMCPNCKRFLFKGIKFCLRCKKTLINRDNPNNWSDLQNRERIEFANAALSDLLWKSNVNCRSFIKPYGEKAKKKKGMQIYHRATKKGVKKTIGGKRETLKWKGCEHRWRTDKTFMRRMKEINGFGIEDMQQFDAWGAQPPKPVQKMSKQERTKKYNQYQWRLAQRRPGGSDTVPTSAYPRQNRQEAQVEGRRPGVTLKESAQWRESKGSSSWKDSAWKGRDLWDTSAKVKEEQSEEEPKQTTSSSSTTWQRTSWPRTNWAETKPPWRKEENQQKRRKP